MKNKGLKIFLGIILALVVVYLLGPKMPKPVYNSDLPAEIKTPELAEAKLRAIDEEAGSIKLENESKLIWFNENAKSKTSYCLLYLHGFSASPMEAYPVHESFARHFKMNALIPRLAEHGLVTEDALLNMTPERLWESAKQSLVIAKALGQKVVIMSTSSGGTLALKLAAEYPEDIAALFLYSPNVKIYQKTAALLSKPWGLQIARMTFGGDYRVFEEDPYTDPYWYSKYRAEAPVYLQQLIETTMTKELFQSVKVPTFVGYYYKDKENQDNTVSVKAIQNMYENLGTPDSLKMEKAFPEAGSHVIACIFTSRSWEDVLNASIEYGDSVLNLNQKRILK